MNISSSESQADSAPAAVTEEAVMSGVADASLGDDLRSLCQSAGISIESLRSALNDFYPSDFDLSKRVRVLSDLCNNQHASDEILQCASEFFTRGEDEAISCLIVRACHDDKSNVVTFLLDKYPSVVEYVHEFRHEGEDYKIPTLYHVLFTLSNKDVALGVLNKLLDERLEFVRNVRVQPSGDTLLHWIAVIAKHSDKAQLTEICRILIETIPSLLNERNIEGLTPLHSACFNVNLTLVKCILEKSPDAIHNTASGGLTPILFATLGRMNLTENPKDTIELTQYLLDFHPSTASVIVESGYPLTHILLHTKEPYLNAGLEVIKLVYDAYPQALILQQSVVSSLIEDGTIDNAVESFVNNQLRFTALTRNVELLNTTGVSGDLPIHSALQHYGDVSFGTIKLMVETSPATLKRRNGNGSLPLHIACASHDSPKVVKYLLDHYDKMSLFVTNNEGDTPLHCACQASNYKIISMIFSDYSNAPVTTRNLNGELPIGLLLYEDEESADYLGSIYRLVRADPLILF